MKQKIACFLFVIIMSPVLHAYPPKLNFSDLISGPGTGIGDGKGSGAIVTIWGNYLGSSKSSSKIIFTDVDGNEHEPAFIYYWKNADSTLPGGPANLFKSHRMQETAFSIPDAPVGLGSVRVETEGVVSNALPFSVTSGRILHVKNFSGSSNGSFDAPFNTIADADSGSNAGIGDIIYIHDVITTQGESDKGAIYNNVGFKADETNQMAYVSYPNTRAIISGAIGFRAYTSTGIVISKLSVFASNCGPNGFDENNPIPNCEQPKGTVGISPTDFGRVIGNSVTDRPGGCADGQAGAISGGVDNVDNLKILGNYVYDYACPETQKLHHTTYMTIRDVSRDDGVDPVVISAWEWGWNFLENNHAKNGIHNFDEDFSDTNSCGDMKTDLLIHDNVIINQAGAGITIISKCGWSQDTYIYNNLLYNVGLPSDINCTFNCGQIASGMQIGDDPMLGDVFIINNSILKWDATDIPNSGSSAACFLVSNDGDNVEINVLNNICYNDKEKPFIGNLFGAEQLIDNFKGMSNIWHHPNVESTSSEFLTPVWDEQPYLGDPGYTISNGIFSLSSSSPALNKGVASPITITHDVYGTPRSALSDLGAVVFTLKPSPPTALQVQ
jgi:hypothetical protein